MSRPGRTGGAEASQSRAEWWDSVKARLAAATREPTPEEVGRLLAARARELAAPLEPERATGELLDHLVVAAAGGRFAVPAAYVGAVLPLGRVTRLPGTPPFVLGLAHHRGDVVSVLDAGRLLGVSGARPPEGGFLVLLQEGEMRFGLAVEDVPGVEALGQDEVEPVPAGSGWGGAYASGVAPGGLVVLDAARLLGDEALIVGHDTFHPAQEEQTT